MQEKSSAAALQTVYYIVPAWSEQAGQCRIVSCQVEGKIDARASYEERPSLWKEAGIMNSRGSIVCLDDPEALADMKQDEPLMAGVQYSYPVTQVETSATPRPRF